MADAMKEEGWEFASHTWGHINVGEASLERLQTDTQKWLDYVKPLVGDTNVIIFAFGSDLGDWQPYTSDNEKFAYLKSMGFDIYCNVDSTQYWVQFGENYMRQGRRNLDGYRMYYNPEMLEDLFEAGEVFDKSRPSTGTGNVKRRKNLKGETTTMKRKVIRQPLLLGWRSP